MVQIAILLTIAVFVATKIVGIKGDKEELYGQYLDPIRSRLSLWLFHPRSLFGVYEWFIMTSLLGHRTQQIIRSQVLVNKTCSNEMVLTSHPYGR